MPPTAREKRLGLNEALWRAANERMEGWQERHAQMETELDYCEGDDLSCHEKVELRHADYEMHAQMETELYYCECDDLSCHEKVDLRHADYERVRADPCYFLIVQGHEDPDVETVIEQQEGWAIVEKEPELERRQRRSAGGSGLEDEERRLDPRSGS